MKKVHNKGAAAKRGDTKHKANAPPFLQQHLALYEINIARQAKRISSRTRQSSAPPTESTLRAPLPFPSARRAGKK